MALSTPREHYVLSGRCFEAKMTIKQQNNKRGSGTIFMHVHRRPAAEFRIHLISVMGSCTHLLGVRWQSLSYALSVLACMCIEACSALHRHLCAQRSFILGTISIKKRRIQREKKNELKRGWANENDSFFLVSPLSELFRKKIKVWCIPGLSEENESVLV